MIKDIIKNISKLNVIVFCLFYFIFVLVILELGEIYSIALYIFLLTFLYKSLKGNIRFEICLILIFTFTFVFVRVSYRRFLLVSESHINAYMNEEVILTGKVTDRDIRSSKSNKYIIKIDNIVVTESYAPIDISNSKVLLKAFYIDYLEIGDVITMECKLTTIINEYEFDYKEYLESKNIYSIINDNYRLMNISKREYSILSVVSNMREEVNKRLFSLIPSPHAELYMGILYGSGIPISEELNEGMSNIGITHIIAVSGYNISLLLLSSEKLSYLFGRRLYSFIAVFLIVFFVLFVGIGNIPVLRAGIMCLFYLIASLIGRKKNTFVILVLNIFVLMVFNINIYKYISFQLTFASTIGIMLMCKFYKKVFKILPDIFLEDFSSTISALSYTIPIILINFGKISLIAPVANLIILPVISYITVGGMIIGLIALINTNILVYLLSYSLWLLLEYIIRVTNILNNIPTNIGIKNQVSRGLISMLIYISNIIMVVRIRNEDNKENY